MNGSQQNDFGNVVEINDDMHSGLYTNISGVGLRGPILPEAQSLSFAYDSPAVLPPPGEEASLFDFGSPAPVLPGSAAPLMRMSMPPPATDHGLSPIFLDLLRQGHTCVLFITAHGQIVNKHLIQGLRSQDPQYHTELDYFSLIGDGYESGFSTLDKKTHTTNYMQYPSIIQDTFYENLKNEQMKTNLDIGDKKTRDTALKAIVGEVGKKINKLNRRIGVKYQNPNVWKKNPSEHFEYSLQRTPEEIYRPYSNKSLKIRPGTKGDIEFFPNHGVYIVWTSNEAQKDYSLVRKSQKYHENIIPALKLKKYNVFNPEQIKIPGKRTFVSNLNFERLLTRCGAPDDHSVFGARQILRRVTNGNPFTLQELSVLFRGLGYTSTIIMSASCQSIAPPITSPPDQSDFFSSQLMDGGSIVGMLKKKQKRYRKTQKKKYIRKRHMRIKKYTRRK